MFQSAPNNY